MIASGKAPWRYRWVLKAVFPLVFAYTVYRGFKDGGWRYCLQRFGLERPKASHRLWLHCASVGEVNTAIPLLTALQEAGYALLVTTATPTGKLVLQGKQLPDIQHHYLPLDYPFAVSRFLESAQPRALLLLETELWPELIHHAQASRTPVLLINARLSARTLNTATWLKNVYRETLQQISHVFAKNAAEAQHFQTLGLSADKLQVIGSLKFATPPASEQAPPAWTQDYWLAASTHEDEEVRIVDAWLAIDRNELLVIAPRHPERRHTLRRQLRARSPHVQLRSEAAIPDTATRIYIADTLGELPTFIAGAKLVFMGGSLIPRGGHNPLEAARAGVPVLTGPSIANFADEYALLARDDAAVTVQNAEALVSAVTDLLNNPETCQQRGHAARNAAQQQGDVAHAYVSQIQQYVPLTAHRPG